MDHKNYKRQVSLLLNVLPEVAKEDCFALHGGTAINLFIRDMPRLSVDIDLTYVPIENRPTSLKNIASALLRIRDRLEKLIPDIQMEHKRAISKLLVTANGVNIKIEVNQVGRGTLYAPKKIALCKKAQTEFDAFCIVPLVPLAQLYGGKICAALDRQHPRDLFDIKYLLDNEGFTDEVKTGFLLSLVGHDRPIHELIHPNFQDQRQTMINHFEGMSDEEFTYAEFEAVREQLVKVINEKLTEKDKEFLLSIKRVEPDWSIYDFERYPAVQWKLRNLRRLKVENPDKHRNQQDLLENKLAG
jgi:predicted nucleotidyltransferase component of viral defense system